MLFPTPHCFIYPSCSCVFFSFNFYFLAVLCAIWDLSFPIRDWTHTLCIRSSVLTTGLQGKSPSCVCLKVFFFFSVSISTWSLLTTDLSSYIHVTSSYIHVSFPGGSDGKACNVGDPGLIPGLGRSPGEGNDNPLQHSCLENPVGGGAW